MVAPALVAANGAVTTSLNKDTTGGAEPIVKAKWEANVDQCTDESTSAGAQFDATGQYEGHRDIALCAIVTDEDGLADVESVYADVFYPEVELGDHHTALTDQSGDGCGFLMQEDSMQRLDKLVGYDLFCNSVHNNNYNLPTFNSTYFSDLSINTTDGMYNEICAADGELMKETAAVYCTEKTISYEDPSGDYEVWAVAQDKNGQQGKLVNHFTYLPTTAFEVDFTSIDYGNVRLNTHKIISGDLTWDEKPGINNASVRNVGNTRLAMQVWQDDMNLGKTDGNYNVKYDARVGSNASFANYWPETTKTLADELDLSELDEMDFSIEVFKFPPTESCFSGEMTLSAVKRSHLTCNNVYGG